MILRVEERLNLLEVIPREGSITTLRIISELRQQLSLSEQEHVELGLKEIALPEGKGARVRWDREKDQGKDVNIGPTAQAIIVRTLQELEKKERLTINQLPLYERFVEGKE